MLDIRATHYPSPLAEVEFTDTALTVHIVNVADETGLVTGRFRVYNDSTGLLIHDSEIAPVTIIKGQTADVSALTDFDPPAPLDDTYFVIFDGNASNALVPDGITFMLGAFYFDVKVGPLGPPPAAHAVTHGAGGSDPLDHGTLPGLADDDHPQYQLRSELGTAGGYCGLPNPLDNTLPIRADGTPAYPTGLFNDLEMLQATTTAHTPWSPGAIAGGTSATAAGEPNHPGIHRYTSAAPASGRYLCTTSTPFLLSGSSRSYFKLRPQTLANSIIRAGFMDTTSLAAIVDGLYFRMDPALGAPGQIVGECSAGGVVSQTATSFVLVTNTWYHLRCYLNAAATLATFEILNDAGVLLWTDTVNANIPTAVGQETGHGIVASSTGTVAIVDVDYLSVEVRRRLYMY
jgi:hypothetical protein